MEQTRKHFNIASIVVLIFAGASLLKILGEIFFGELNSVEGYSADIVFITKIFLLVFSILMLLPQIYIGVKGLLLAKKPNTSKGHLVWAIILMIFSVSCLIDPFFAVVNKESIFDNIVAISGIILEIIVFYDYFKAGSALLRETKK